MNLIVDIGNTQVKAAVFELNSLVDHFIFDEKNFQYNINSILEKYTINRGILSSVKEINKETLSQLESMESFIRLESDTKIPFENKYTTPKTLGKDRVALVSAAATKFPNKNVLIIDAGTCITYDILNAKKEYLGGAISPGINMRYKSLNYYTSKLPELSIIDEFSLIGNSTSNSIHSGIINGVIQEIEGVINQYQERFKDLTVVLTGGDTKFLSKRLKNSIFANQNFLLYGLNKILTFNNQE